MRKASLSNTALLLVTLLLVACQPIRPDTGPATRQFDAAAIQQAHDQILSTKGVYRVVEQVVDFQNEGQKVMATLALPDGGTPPHPVVLLFHGFTGTRNELPITGTEEAMYSRTARILAENGIASLRIDFRGSGESEGLWEDTTFTGQISDALAAIEYLATVAEVDHQRLALIGLSQGGLVAAETAARDPRVQSVILWSPVASPPDTYKLILGAEAVDAGMKSGGEPVHVVLPWGAEIDLRTPFFEDLYHINPIAAISMVKRPLLVIVGSRDTVVTPQPHYGQVYINYHPGHNGHPGDEMLVTLDGDHVFDVLSDQGPKVLDDAIAWSLAWLQQTLR